MLTLTMFANKRALSSFPRARLENKLPPAASRMRPAPRRCSNKAPSPLAVRASVSTKLSYGMRNDHSSGSQSVSSPSVRTPSSSTCGPVASRTIFSVTSSQRADLFELLVVVRFLVILRIARIRFTNALRQWRHIESGLTHVGGLEFEGGQ